MADNLTQAPEKVLCDLINRENTAQGSALTPELVSFGLPTQSNDLRNTDITVSAKEGSGYVGQAVINYNRPHLQSDIVDVYIASKVGRNAEFSVGNSTNISDLVGEINARFGINLTADDYVDAVLPSFTGTPGEVLNVNVVAKADSLVYRGSFTFQLKSEDIDLATVILTKQLNGITYQAPA